MIRNLEVYLWNRKVGSLVACKERYTEKICFYFDRDFLDSGYDIAPLRASIHSVSVSNGLPVYGESEKLFGGLPSFIADSLPDHWGNKVFNEWAKIHRIRTRDCPPSTAWHTLEDGAWEHWSFCLRLQRKWNSPSKWR